MAGRVPLNAFGIAFGTAGLAGTWGAAADAGLVPRVVSDIVWVVVAAALGLVAVRYVQGVGDVRTAVDDLRHPVLGPFAALVPATGMLLGARLLRADRTAGEVVVLTGAVVAAVFGCWFLTGLLAGDRPLVTVHPGYLLPTTAAPLIGAQAFAVAGWRVASMAALGLGVLSWCLIGALLLGRLALGPPLPSALVPTLAILSAPPAVLGNALRALGDDTGPVQQLVLGTFVLLVGVQLMLVPRYAALDFGLGWWAYTFTVAASATYAIRWLSVADDPVGRVLSWLVVALATTVIGSIAAASLTLPRRTSRRDLSKEHA